MKENLKHRVSQIFRGFWSFGKQFKMFENRTRLAPSDYPGMRLLLSCCSSGSLRQPALQPPQAYLWGPWSCSWYSWFRWPSRPSLWHSSSWCLSECSRKRLLWWGLWGSHEHFCNHGLRDHRERVFPKSANLWCRNMELFRSWHFSSHIFGEHVKV